MTITNARVVQGIVFESQGQARRDDCPYFALELSLNKNRPGSLSLSLFLCSFLSGLAAVSRSIFNRIHCLACWKLAFGVPVSFRVALLILCLRGAWLVGQWP